MSAKRVLGRVAEDVFSAAVEVDDALALIDRDDRVGRDREDAGELRFGRAQRLLRIPLRAEPRSEIEVLNDQKGERSPCDQRDDEQA